MPWSTIAHGEIVNRRTTLSHITSLKDAAYAHRIFTGGAVFLFLVLIARAILSFSTLFLLPSTIEATPPPHHYAFLPVLQVDTGGIKADTGSAKVNTSKTKVDTSSAKVDTGKTKVDTSSTKARTGRIKADPRSVMADTGRTKVDSGSTKVDTSRTKVDSGSTKVDTSRTKVDSGSTKVDTGGTNVDSISTKVDTSRSKVDSGSTKVDTGRTKVDTSSTNVGTKMDTGSTPPDTLSENLNENDSLDQDEDSTETEISDDDTTGVQPTTATPSSDTTVTIPAIVDSAKQTKGVLPPIKKTTSLSDSTNKKHPNVDSLKPKPGKLPKLPVPKIDTTAIEEENSEETDSLDMVSDSTKNDSTKSDSSYTIFLDSTWRVQQHIHHRNDNPTVTPFLRHNSSLYLDINSPAFIRETVMDSTGKFVTVRERVNGLDVKVPMTLTLDDYIHKRIENDRIENWRTMTYAYDLAAHEKGLGSLFSSFTNIEIPVPANPLFSIFGKNKISIHITGEVTIQAGFKNTTSDVQTLARQDQSLNEPNFNQTVSINVDGTVGDKLKIGADWNTQRTFEYENSLKIKYQGYDDEIVKTVEAGNVSLSVPSFVGSSQALFGIKALMQFGPLNLTALVSQKKGSSKEVSVSGGTRTVGNDIQITNYSKAHYFLDTVYRHVFEAFHVEQTPRITSDDIALGIDQYYVWKSTKNPSATNAREAIAYYDLPAKLSGEEQYDSTDLAGLSTDVGDGSYASLRFVQLTAGTEYILHENEGYISLSSPPGTDEVIAVAYSTKGYNGVNKLYYGEFANNTATDTSHKLVLKLIKPAGLYEGSKEWNLMLKNIYSLNARDIKKDGLDLKVFYKQTGVADVQEVGGVNLLQLLRLDRFSANGATTPDFVFDFLPITIDPTRGELIFPELRPFDSTLAREFSAHGISNYDSLLIHEFYDKNISDQEKNSTHNNMYVIRASVAGAVSARIPLNSFNIVEGSVQVLFNGTPLSPGVDYDVNYIIGEVNIRKEEALVPGANLQVKFEQNDLFALASKTLMGARGELDVGRDSKLGFTIMNLNQETLSDKVRIGEEPTNNTILGVDGSSQWNLPFLTSALNYIPGFHSREMSSFKFSGEAAYILPNPNTKTSTIASDNGASIAYIDDFEGARRLVPLNVNYSSWRSGSVPVHTLLDPAISIADTSKMFSKARLSWFNNSQAYEPVSVKDIWPDKSVRKGEELVPLLIMDFDPLRRGMFNYSLNIDSTLLQHPEKNWNGIQRYVANIAGDLTQQNLKYLELWVKATSTDSFDLRKGKLFVDIGRISEDVIPDRKLNSEDIIKTSDNPSGIANGIVNNGEDLGLDMLSDDQERAKYADLIQRYPDMGGDPSGDDFDYTTGSNNFDQLNGTENNFTKNAIDGRTPDTEDLNNSSVVETANDYIEYEIPITDTLANGDPNKYIVGGGTNKWYQIRIALLDTSRVEGSTPAANILQGVQFVRLWLSGYTKKVRLRIAEINFVGNQWLESKRDSIMKVSVVNVEDNPDYSSPPGVIRERDRTQPDQEVYGNEQSLALLFNGLKAGDSREVAKYFAQRPMDMFSYKALKLFVHGDRSFGEDAEVYFRFGSDTSNYYEYSQPLHSDWDEMSIIFTEITSVKAARDSGATYQKIPAPSGPAGSYYSIRGNPAITRVQYLGIGVRNVSGTYPIKTRYTDPPRALTGEVWVNELRVVDVDNSPGGAYRINTELKLADFGSASFNYSYTDPNFHGIDVAFGDRVTHKSWAVNTSFSLHQLLPQSWQGASFPVAYSHQENILLPKYLPNTDVVVSEAARRAGERKTTPETQQAASDRVITESQTISVSDNVTVSNLKFGLPWKVWYIRDIINNLAFHFNFSQSYSHDPATFAANTWQWGFGMNYGLTLNHNLTVQPFSKLFAGIPILQDYKDWKLYLFPITGFSGSLDGSRSRNYAQSRTPNSPPRDTRTFAGSKQLSLNWKISEGGLIGLGGDYGLSLRRDLLYADTVGNRDFSQIVRALFFGGRDGQYSQSVNFATKPKFPNILDITKYLDQISAGYRVNYGWQNNFQGGNIGKSASWENSINLGTNFHLKALADTWFKDDESSEQTRPPVQRTPPPAPKAQSDTTNGKTVDTTAVVVDEGPHVSPFKKIKQIAKILIKYPLLDYENIGISFQQSNRSANSGVVGGTGFQNFWGVLPFQHPNSDSNGGGPSRMYQLGLVSDPSATLRFTNHFPFLEAVSYRGAEGWVPNSMGIRAIGANLTNDFSQKNDIGLKTNRPLWDGASLELNWKVSWQYHKVTTFATDSLLGLPLNGTSRTSGSVERSFMALPPVFLFKVFKSGLEDVGKRYDENIKSAEYQNNAGGAAANAFEHGMETLPFLNKLLGQFVPRANWNLSWNGIEKLAGITSWVQSLSLNHSYHSTLRRDFHLENGAEVTDIERISYDFSPLIGVNATFKELLKGDVRGTFQYKTSTAYDLSMSNQKITEDVTTEMALTLNYSRHGFEFPLFGLHLKNDLEFSFTYSRAKKARRMHDPAMLQTNQDGTPLDGDIRTTMEPRIRYTLSARVTASVYYRYTRTAPDEGGSTIPGTTTNEAGLDLHIAIN